MNGARVRTIRILGEGRASLKPPIDARFYIFSPSLALPPSSLFSCCARLNCCSFFFSPSLPVAIFRVAASAFFVRFCCRFSCCSFRLLCSFFFFFPGPIGAVGVLELRAHPRRTAGTPHPHTHTHTHARARAHIHGHRTDQTTLAALTRPQRPSGGPCSTALRHRDPKLRKPSSCPVFIISYYRTWLSSYWGRPSADLWVYEHLTKRPF